MKKSISAIALAATILLSACNQRTDPTSTNNFDDTPSSANSASVENTGSPLNNNTDPQDGMEPLSLNADTAYDKTPYQNVSVDKCYYLETSPGAEDIMYDLFDGTPETSDRYGNITYTLGDVSARYNGAEGGSFLYWTERGMEMSHITEWQAYRHLSTEPMVSLVEELDFMSREEVTAEIKKQLSKYSNSDFDVRLYAVSREGYLWLGEQAYGSDFEPVEDPTDYYYAEVYPSVDGIPLSPDCTGHYEYGDWGNTVRYEILYTEKGMEYLYADFLCNIGEAVPAEGDFISVDEAENLLKDSYGSGYDGIRDAFKEVKLVYAPMKTRDRKTLLTPAWAFFTEDEVGITVIFNALTGEKLATNGGYSYRVIPEIR